MLNREETLLIFGRSEYINDISDSIPFLTEYYHTISINSVEIPTEYVVFLDVTYPLVNRINKGSHKVITSYNNCSYLNPKLDITYVQYQLYDPNNFEPYDKDYLRYAGFTHDLAVSWGISKGFKTIVLLGVADFTKWHYDSRTLFKYSNRIAEQSCNFLERCQECCKIYKTNNSRLRVPIIDFEKLL